LKAILFRILIPFVAIQFFVLGVYGEQASQIGDYLDDNVIESLPKEIAEAIEANEEYGGPTIQSALNYVSGVLKDLIEPASGNFFKIIAVVILCSCFYMLSGICRESELTRIYRFLASACLCLMVFGILDGLWKELNLLLKQLNTLMNSVTVATTSVYALSGSVTAATVNQSQMMIVFTLIEDVIYYSTYPVLQICLSTSFIGCIGESVDLSSLGGLIRKTFTTLLIVLMSIVTAVLSFQNTLAQSNDSFMLRTVKLASGSFVPLVGSALSEATATIAAGMNSLKNSLGIISIIALIATVLPLFITMWLNKFFFSAASSFCEALCLERESRFLKGSAEILDFAIAIITAVTMIFVINLMIFVKSEIVYGR